MFNRNLVDRLPPVRGTYRENSNIAALTWFRVGGPAEVLFKPKDAEDLAFFISNVPPDIPVIIFGVGSNLLIRDGGIPGVVIRLNASFGQITVDPNNNRITAGAFALDSRVAQQASKAGIGGLSFFAGIPGTIGGALRMNAGAHSCETKDCLVSGKAISPQGKRTELSPTDFGHSYRHCALDPAWLFVQATFQGQTSTPEKEALAIKHIQNQRESTQPIKERTGGSTFKNPLGGSAWKCIEAAGMRGFKIGDAQVSKMHCNFLTNQGRASAYELETLGETIRARVFESQGILLEWEIRRVGIYEDNKNVDVFIK